MSGDILRTWLKIQKEIKECQACRLHTYRKNAVPGEGNLSADVLLLGEAPGRREDELGRPFVGVAGKLLDNLLSSINLSRSDVFITNVVKCRPPNNRDPKEDEIIACSKHTVNILRLVRPKVIVTLGNYAGKFIFEYLTKRKWLGISKNRGKIYKLNIEHLGAVLVIPTYHPAAALYNPKLRGYLDNDFKLILNAIKSSKELRKGTTLLDFMR